PRPAHGTSSHSTPVGAASAAILLFILSSPPPNEESRLKPLLQGVLLASWGRIDHDAPLAHRNPACMTTEPTSRSELAIAVFADFENLALGAEQSKKGRFQMEVVLKRLLERGR